MFFCTEVKLFFGRGPNWWYLGEDLDLYLRRFNERVTNCCDLVEEVLVNILPARDVGRILYLLGELSFSFFSRLMKAARKLMSLWEDLWALAPSIVLVLWLSHYQKRGKLLQLLRSARDQGLWIRIGLLISMHASRFQTFPHLHVVWRKPQLCWQWVKDSVVHLYLLSKCRLKETRKMLRIVPFIARREIL